MDQKDYKGGGIKTFFRLLCYVAFGISLFYDPFVPLNIFNVIFGTFLIMIIGWLYKKLLRFILSLTNKDLKNKLGKTVIYIAVDNAMLFLIPFAVMILLANHLLRWGVGTMFFSSALMVVGASASMEIGRLLEKPKGITSMATSALSFVFAYGIITLALRLSFVPGLLEGGISFLRGGFL